TGFLGFMTFLIGWGAIYFIVRKFPERFFFLQQSYLVVSIVALFSLPLNNTSLLLLFLYMLVLPVTFDSGNPPHSISLGRTGRILTPVALFLLFYFAIFLPYVADREFKKALASNGESSSEIHLEKATRYNPYQPYYNFTFVKRIV